MVMVMTEEVSHIHLLSYLVDGSSPLISMAVVITAVQQRLVAGNEQRLSLVKLLCIFHKRSRS
jgi:hypothetical protein